MVVGLKLVFEGDGKMVMGGWSFAGHGLEG